MGKRKKLIAKIKNRQQVSYEEAEALLIGLGYKLDVKGSHHVFRKLNCKHVNLKRRPQLLLYQLVQLEEAIDENG